VKAGSTGFEELRKVILGFVLDPSKRINRFDGVFLESSFIHSAYHYSIIPYVVKDEFASHRTRIRRLLQKQPPQHSSKGLPCFFLLATQKQPQQAGRSVAHSPGMKASTWRRIEKWILGRNSEGRILCILARYSIHPVLQPYVRWISTFSPHTNATDRFWGRCTMGVSVGISVEFLAPASHVQAGPSWLLAGNKGGGGWPRTGSPNSKGEIFFFAVFIPCSDHERRMGNRVCYIPTLEKTVLYTSDSIV